MTVMKLLQYQHYKTGIQMTAGKSRNKPLDSWSTNFDKDAKITK